MGTHIKTIAFSFKSTSDELAVSLLVPVCPYACCHGHVTSSGGVSRLWMCQIFVLNDYYGGHFPVA